MLILLSAGITVLLNNKARNIARLVTPRNLSRLNDIPREGLLWAADNDAYSGFNAERFENMLDMLTGIPGGLFVTVPDVVADTPQTLDLFEKWYPRVSGTGLPVALVAQDGMTPDMVPWNDIQAMFIGGTNDYKLGEPGRIMVKAAQERRRWVHIGRVNSWTRMQYCKSIGADSCDGSMIVRFNERMTDVHAMRAASPNPGHLWHHEEDGPECEWCGFRQYPADSDYFKRFGPLVYLEGETLHLWEEGATATPYHHLCLQRSQTVIKGSEE